MPSPPHPSVPVPAFWILYSRSPDDFHEFFRKALLLGMVGCILPAWRSISFPSARCTLLGERSPLETPAVASGTDRARNIFNGRLPLWPQIRPLRVAIVERSSCSRRESRSSTPKKASPMSQDVARRAARRTRRAGTPRVAAAATRPPDPDPARTPAATIDQSARCTPPFARPAARILR